ncbi:hypothetical protein ANCCAN_30478 [Ancylostoma caninum]|uniref:Uncharacterized protein n=1 Tax=Ancylostoma caninum TaxID=29170 RepID=A0A368EW03_ANCCA|nr:hypothetical protein ANCCAN_30478 [Ancylostoma caninum]
MIPSDEPNRTNELYDQLSVGIHFARDLENAPRALDYARTLVQIERLCENPEAARTNFDYSLDVSLAEALERPHLCCARTAVGGVYLWPTSAMKGTLN